jgi:Ca2+-binding EF-hand superfamily protein
LGVDLSDQQVDELFDRVDVASTGCIEYSEFVVAAMNEEGFLKSAKLKRAFDTFDVDKTGFIAPDDLKIALAGYLTGNKKVDNALVAKIIEEVDYEVSYQSTFHDILHHSKSHTNLQPLYTCRRTA